MKTMLYTTAVAALCLLTQLSYAKIWRINNNDESANYASLKAAIEDNVKVNGGDTLMVEGSAIVYEGATLTKRLIIIGPGYFLTENPNTQANGSEAAFSGSITFAEGSEGSALIGISFNSGYPTINVNNITILRCRLTGNGIYIGYQKSVKSIIISQCYVGSIYGNYGFSDVILTNNIFTANIDVRSSSSYQKVFSQVENNLFLGRNLILSADVFINNIVTTSEDITVTSGDIRNNLAANGQFGSDKGNQDYNPNNDVLFLNPEGNSTDGKWRISDESPYKAIGFNGVEPGPFGGANPYVLSGIPPIPVIYELRTQGVGNQSTGLPVIIKVKSY